MKRLSLIILTVLFFAAPYAEAQVPSDPKDMESMRAFVDTAKARALEADFTEFRKEVAVEGVWKQGTTYLIVLELDGFPFIHAYDKSLEDRDLSSQELVARALASPEECFEYEDHEGVSGRYACSSTLRLSGLLGRTLAVDRTVLLIGGLHTAPPPEEPIEELLGGSYVPEIVAADVRTAEDLKLFVDGAIEAITTNFGLNSEENNLLFSRFRPVLRREGGPWNVGDIYIYIMREDEIVIFHGDNQKFEDTTIQNITDSNGCVIAEELQRVIAGEERECKSLGLLPENPEGFLEYLWDNPDVEGDEDPIALKDRRVSPGFSPKLGYVKRFMLPFGLPAVIGSGIYPKEEEEGGSGGCSLWDSKKSFNFPNLVFLGLFLLLFMFISRRGLNLQGRHDNQG